MRPSDSPEQVGDATKARDVLGWRPTRDFESVVSAMVDSDVALLDRH
jgi:GDPmannose 4,6-dehydratase